MQRSRAGRSVPAVISIQRRSHQPWSHAFSGKCLAVIPGSNATRDHATKSARLNEQSRPAVVALVGNPNTGKTTLFNALTGFRRKVANYPGVTVDVGRGPIRGICRPTELLDLPGTYSLAAVSPDEMVVCHALCGRADERGRPDAVLAIADASNLRRNLYLISQMLELGLPVVVALNMVDVARARGIEIDAAVLSRRLGIPVIPVVATDRKTVAPLVAALEAALDAAPAAVRVTLPEPLAEEASRLASPGDGSLSFTEALRVLADRDGCAEKEFLARGGSAARVQEARQRLAATGIDPPAAEVRARYAWIGQILDGTVSRPEQPVVTWSDRIDRVMTHPVAGGAVLLFVLFAVFQSIFWLAAYPMQWLDAAFGRLGGLVASTLPHEAVQSLIVDGLIGGVGGVLVFLPQILILFAVIAILEDCGYMARAASMVDRLMRAVGLSGRAFIPLLSAFACAVPAIMGARTIADRRQRFVTILVTPFMSCSARLPVYVLMIAAFVPATRYLGGWVGLQGLVMVGMYLVGVVVAVPIAWLLKNTAFAGPTPGFLLELPSYKRPRLGTIWQRVYLSARSFVIRAGTVILLVNLLVWALGYFPRSQSTLDAVRQQAQAESWDAGRFETELAGAYLRDSYLGRMGHAIEPVIAPIGWDWRVGIAVIASFPAREVIVATLGTITNLGEQEQAESEPLQHALRKMRWENTGRPVFTLPVALSIMVFFALCAQCSATLVVIGREMGSWLWPVISFIGMTTLAYFAAWGTAAVARALISA